MVKETVTGAARLRDVPSDKFALCKKKKTERADKLSFDIIGGESVMPRGAWWGPYRVLRDGYPDYLSDEYFGYMKDAELNFVCAVPNNVGSHPEVIEESLSLCEKYNVGYFVNDYSFRKCDEEEMKRNLPRYINRAACIGVHVFDEPYPEDFAALKKATELYRKLTDDSKPLYFNLFPSYGKFGDDAVRLKNYEKYLDDFCSELGVKMLSYDYYAFKKREYERGRLKLFFDNLAIAGAVAKKHSLPLWTFVQAGDAFFGSGNDGEKAFPTTDMLIWNVNVNLAYGAKAMQYFTFIQPAAPYPEKSFDMDCRSLGMIGADGKKNIWFDAVKSANGTIRSLERFLMNARHRGVMASGEKTVSLLDGQTVLPSFGEIRRITGGETVTGCFDYRGAPAIYVVNNDYEKETVAHVELDAVYAFEAIAKGKSQAFAADKFTLNLSAGEGVFIRLL